MRSVAAAVVVLGILAGCSDAPRSARPQQSQSSPLPVIPQPSGTAGASVAPAPSGSAQPGVTTQATASSTGGSRPGARVTATIDRACVRRGTDTQGLTVRNARPGGYVGYSTEYSDHSNEVSNRSYTTGYGYGRTDPFGGYRATWVVPATAPPGLATLRVIYNASDPPIVLTFDVVPQNGTC